MPRHAITILLSIFALRAPALGQAPESTLVLHPKLSVASYDALPHDPVASAFFSFSIPGLGQLYNRDYPRAGIVFGSFVAGAATVLYEYNRWVVLNTDTFYIAESYPFGGANGQIRSVIAPKPADQQVGLPTAEKVVLGAAIAVTAVSWIGGIVDAYKGAGRYNKRLSMADAGSLRFDLAYLPENNAVGLTAKLRF